MQGNETKDSGDVSSRGVSHERSSAGIGSLHLKRNGASCLALPHDGVMFQSLSSAVYLPFIQSHLGPWPGDQQSRISLSVQGFRSRPSIVC
ncbi:hypothetical protein MPLA_2130120 [Mesorhizobium sp. ORS 3359]|nr:hypothetical protein MPLA_2130120 [Mesorhizobium sp. ORS 3359]